MLSLTQSALIKVLSSWVHSLGNPGGKARKADGWKYPCRQLKDHLLKHLEGKTAPTLVYSDPTRAHKPWWYPDPNKISSGVVMMFLKVKTLL